jgi:DNA-binding NarL/FixJ family response regulator
MPTENLDRQNARAGNGEKQPSGKNRVMLVDDHPVVIEGLTSVINREVDLTVCGHARNVGEALQRIQELRPDICVVDVSLDSSHGIDLVKDMQISHPQLPAIMLSMHDEKVYAERALRAGAKGYLMKREPPQKLLQAIRKILRGEVYFSEIVTNQLLRQLSSTHKSNALPIQRLNDRELEVFEWIGRGFSTRKCAEQLHLSSKAVRSHVDRLKKKLEVADHTHLIRLAVQWIESNP